MEKVFEFLKKNNITTMATCSVDKPRASVMEYHLIDNNIIFATDPSSIKANNLKKNNRISLSVHNMPYFVTVDGTVAEPSKAEVDEFNRRLIENHPEFVEMMKSGMMNPFVYFKVLIDTAYYNDYTQGMAPTQIIKK